MSEEVEPYYLRLGVKFIDDIFDMGYFHEEVTRKDLRALDELVGYMLQSQSESAAKCATLLRRIREKPDAPGNRESGGPGSVEANDDD